MKNCLLWEALGQQSQFWHRYTPKLSGNVAKTLPSLLITTRVTINKPHEKGRFETSIIKTWQQKRFSKIEQGTNFLCAEKVPVAKIRQHREKQEF